MSEFRAPWAGEIKGKGPCLILGLAMDGRMLLVIHDDGQAEYVEPFNVVFDIRYDWRNHQWIDVSEAWSSDHPEEGTTDTGGQEVPGDVPELDGGDGGHPLS